MPAIALVAAAAALASTSSTVAPSTAVRGVVAPTSKVDLLKVDGQSAIDRRAMTAAELPAARERIQLLSLASSPIFLDEQALVAAQGFPFSEAELISMTKTFLFFDNGITKPELLANDMVFMGPFVGGKDGLPRDAYLSAVGGFDIKAAFPDLNPGFHHFRADPLDAGRVWFTSTASGTDTGGFLGNAPTGLRFETPPQACSVKFNAEGRVTKFTIGHVMERSIGNTGGLGGIFGPAYAIGKPLPFPEAQPWRPSKRYRMLMLVGKLGSWLKSLKSKGE